MDDESTTSQRNLIRVRGSATEHVLPDIAYIHLEFQAKNGKAQSAVESVAKTTQAVIAQMRSRGVAERDIETVSYTNSKMDAAFKGHVYTTTNRLRVALRELSTIGSILDDAAGAGATLKGVKFAVTEKKAIHERVLAEAARDARRKAELLADASGASVDSLISLFEESPGYSRHDISFDDAMSDLDYEPETLGARRRAAPPETPIAPPELVVSAAITAAYSIRAVG